MKLSPHFDSKEFRCKNRPFYSPVPSTHIAALRYLCTEILEPLRARFGTCTVHSGYRTKLYNRAISGARNSFHVYPEHDRDDVAADVSFARGSVREWHSAAEKLMKEKRNSKGGLGFYPSGGFIHIDTRDYVARWNGS